MEEKFRPEGSGIILQTQRLFLRELREADYADLAEMLQDEAVMYAYEHTFSDDNVREWLDRQRMRYEKYGFGLWAAVLKDGGGMIGQAGLTMQPCEGEAVLEIGYLLKRSFWRRGYAREAAAACREYAFETLGATTVYSIIREDNLASIRVAQAIGMKREKAFSARYYNGDRPHLLFSVSRETP